MRQTVKLCQIRDCHNGKYAPCPHDAVDTCCVFRDVESGRWYHEAASTRIVPMQIGDEFFDIEAWLEQEYIRDMLAWSQKIKVHDKCLLKIRTKPARAAAPSPKFTAGELDHMASSFLRDRQEMWDIKQRISTIGQEIGGYKRLQRKYGEQSVMREQIELLQEERVMLEAIVAEFDKKVAASREYVDEDRSWVDRWRKTSARTGDIIYLYSTNGKMHEINRHGVMVDMMYVYLPENDMAHFECLSWCEENLGIQRSAWIQTRFDDDKIGKPLRQSGKKNANGARIEARFKHTQYEEETLKFKWALVKEGVSMHELHYGSHAAELYEKNVRDKIKRD